jgi:hypothetical protein
VSVIEGLIKRIVGSFNDAGIDYMITGALAASYYGTPRTTMDIDVVVRPTLEDLRTLVTALKKADMHIDEDKIYDALKSEYKIVTVRDKKTPFTLDIILSDKKLEKKAGTILKLPTFYQNPEELILAKLRMIKATIPIERAQKDREDVKTILEHTRINIKNLRAKAEKEHTLIILEDLIE